ncbi:hypothetical protein ES703_83435 [subsurface metagenome]
MDLVVAFRQLLIHMEHLQGYDLKPLPFKAGNNFANEAPLQSVGFQQHQCLLHRYNPSISFIFWSLS